MSTVTQLPLAITEDALEQAALEHTAEELERAWDGDRCPACSAGKWCCYPFCRKCSIRLQRIGLMRELKLYRGHTFARISRFTKVSRRFVRRYDNARDYLISTERMLRDGTLPTREAS